MKLTDKPNLKLNFDTQHNNWRMAKDHDKAEGPGHYPGVKVDYDHDGVITFLIQNPKGVTFAKESPFTLKASNVTVKDFGDQFTFSGEGTDTLVVKDANANKDGTSYNGGDYPYELHFSNGTTLDPIITNGGCCHPPIQSYLSYYAVGAIALIALLVLILRPLLAKRSDAAMKDRDRG